VYPPFRADWIAHCLLRLTPSASALHHTHSRPKWPSTTKERSTRRLGMPVSVLSTDLIIQLTQLPLSLCAHCYRSPRLTLFAHLFSPELCSNPSVATMLHVLREPQDRREVRYGHRALPQPDRLERRAVLEEQDRRRGTSREDREERGGRERSCGPDRYRKESRE